MKYNKLFYKKIKKIIISIAQKKDENKVLTLINFIIINI